MLAHKVEAVVLAPTAGWETETLPLLRKHNTPFVLVDRMSEVRCDQVGTENEAVSVALVEHLLELGHRRVGMLTGLAGLSTTGERVHGYLRAHEALGHPVDKQLIVPGLSTVGGGRSAVNTLLRLRQRPTAIFSGNNAMTIGALLALKQAHLSIPDEMALVTFDDFEWASAISPALTAAAQPFHAVGAQAVQLLQRRLADPFAPRRVIRLPAEIEHRESCGCRATEETGPERRSRSGGVSHPGDLWDSAPGDETRPGDHVGPSLRRCAAAVGSGAEDLDRHVRDDVPDGHTGTCLLARSTMSCRSQAERSSGWVEMTIRSGLKLRDRVVHGVQRPVVADGPVGVEALVAQDRQGTSSRRCWAAVTDGVGGPEPRPGR